MRKGAMLICQQRYLRPDIESIAKVHRTPPTPAPRFMSDACMICSKIWFTESEYACELPCEHFLCLEDLTELVDMRGGKSPPDHLPQVTC